MKIKKANFDKMARNRRHWLELYENSPEFKKEFPHWFFTQLAGAMLTAWSGMSAGILAMFSLIDGPTVTISDFQIVAIPGIVGFVIMTIEVLYITPKYRDKWGFEK